VLSKISVDLEENAKDVDINKEDGGSRAALD